jgi:bacterioferritin
VKNTLALLNHALATEIVCILRYKFHAVTATGLSSESVKEEFPQHAKGEEEHLDLFAEPIDQLGGKPNTSPRVCCPERPQSMKAATWWK